MLSNAMGEGKKIGKPLIEESENAGGHEDEHERFNPAGFASMREIVRKRLEQARLEPEAVVAERQVTGVVDLLEGNVVDPVPTRPVETMQLDVEGDDVLVGWLTHEFHSVVFGFVFAGLVSVAPGRYRDSVPAHVGIGIGWGLVLWFVAAGVISAVWLRLLGIPAPLPSLSSMTLATHLAWGGSLGALTALGYEHAAPRLSRLGERRGR